MVDLSKANSRNPRGNRLHRKIVACSDIEQSRANLFRVALNEPHIILTGASKDATGATVFKRTTDGYHLVLLHVDDSTNNFVIHSTTQFPHTVGTHLRLILEPEPTP